MSFSFFIPKKYFCIIPVTLLLGISSMSCERIKKKSHALKDSAVRKVRTKKDAAIDRVFPIYDSHKADTKFNKKRFKEYFGIELTPDVSDIYCYGDFLGIDYVVLFSFHANPTTVEKIIEKLELKRAESKGKGLSLSTRNDFPWWDSDKIKKIKPYIKDKDSEFWQLLWYDTDNNRVYYEEYSL